MKCLFCENEKIDFTCEKCSTSFCINHIATTEQWECRKHFIKYSKAIAAETYYRCTVVEESKCPECSALLQLDRLSSGQYYLKCTTCSWNSYLKTPGLFFASKEKLAREANRYGLVSGFKPCGKRLKYYEGKQVCPKCFLDLLKQASITNFSTIMSSFNITEEQMIRLITKYLQEEQIYGIIDKKNNMFYYIPPEIREKLVSKFYDDGIIKMDDLALMLDVGSEIILQIIYKLLSQYKIKGSFSLDKKVYYTQTYIISTIIKEINSKGRISLEELANRYDIPKDLMKSFCVNLMRTKEITAFFANKGNDVITSSQIYKEIQKFAEENGKFELTKLANELKIAVELARRSLHDLIKNGKIKGIFTQRREFITEKYLQKKIKELAKAYRTMPLRELSNRLSVTESSIEEMLALLIGKGEIDGYIDMAKRLFVAYSVSTVQQYEPPKRTKHKDEDKIEVVREYDFVGGQVRFKIVVRNNSNLAINNVKIIIDAPTSYKIKEAMINIPVIESGNSRGVDFYIEPKECGISNIAGTVIYKNAQGVQHSIPIKKKEVQIKCPLVCTSFSTIEDCQLAIQSLPNDARAFLIADLDPRLAYRAAIRTVKNFDTSMITSHEDSPKQEGYKAEAWFCAEAKVTGGRIITRVYVSEVNQSLEVRVWTANPGQLTGFLAKIIEILFEEINIIRKIRSEEREKTIDVMAITQNLAETSDYCMLRWKALNIRNKLHDTFVRLRKLLGDDNPILGRIEYWLTLLNKYEKDESINDKDAEKLADDVDKFKNVLTRFIQL
ncbi:MAG: PCI domain-containing protein [Candidatus Lokiarchaeota archaeon]|nr:PCI domain-containing protein [Candidatus Lokiarchaeota archaeon]